MIEKFLLSDLFEFPFKAEVWGTASDWVIAVTTMVTVYYIVKTFRSQLIVQKSQLDLLQIEIDRYVSESKPDFELEEFNYYGDEVDPESPNFVYILKKRGELDALDFQISPGQYYNFENCGAQKIYRKKDSLTLLFFLKDSIGENKNMEFHCFLTFKDRYSNSYRQVINAYFDNDKTVKSTISRSIMNEGLRNI